MERSFEDEINQFAQKMREGASELIQEMTSNIEVYDQLRWHMAAECSHAVAIMRLLDHRNSVATALVERLAPQMLPPPVPEKGLGPASKGVDVDVDEGTSIAQIVKAMRAEEERLKERHRTAAQQDRRAPPPDEDWGHDVAYAEFYKQQGNGGRR